MMGIRFSDVASGLMLLAFVGCQSVHTPDDGKRWGAAEPIETSALGEAHRPQVAMDAAGNAVAVWDDPNTDDTFGDDIWSNRYRENDRWGNAELLEEDEAGDAIEAQVAMDPDGNAVAVWSQNDGTRSNIRSARYTPSDGWGGAVLLETDDTGDARRPQVAMSSNGDAVAVWQQHDGTHFNIRSNRYTSSAGWGGAVLLETDDTGDARRPQVAMSSNGNAVAVWHQSDGTRDNIWSNRYTPSGSWDTAPAEPIDDSNEGSARFPQVAIDGTGNAIAVWQQSDATGRFDIWANHYTPTGEWDVAKLIETEDAGDASAPQVAMDPNGSAVAVWMQADGTSNDIWSNRYTQGQGWGTPEPIETDGGVASFPEVAMDPNGSAVAVWIQFDGVGDSVFSNRYTQGGPWGRHQPIDSDDATAGQPHVVMDPEGNAVAVWRQFPSIWSNRLCATGHCRDEAEDL